LFLSVVICLDACCTRTTRAPACRSSNENTSLHPVKRQPIPLNPPTLWRNVARHTVPTASSTETPESHSQTSSAQRQTSSSTSVRRRSSEESSQVSWKKLNTSTGKVRSPLFQTACSNSWSKIKYPKNFTLQQNLESNISLHYGSKSAELYNNSSALLTSYLDSGVNKVILCCSTNDIANLPFTSHSVKEIAQHVTDVISKFNTLCKSKNASLLHVTPTPNSYVSDTGFKEFSEALNSLLASNQIHSSSARR